MGGTGASSTALTSCHVAVAPGTWARRGADREEVGECDAWVESSGLPFGDPRLPRTLSPSPAPQVPSCPAAHGPGPQVGPSVPQLQISLKGGFLQSSVRAMQGQEGDPTASWAGFSLGQELAGNTKMSAPHPPGESTGF